MRLAPFALLLFAACNNTPLLTCDAGTVEVDGKCLVKCGTGTYNDGGVCVAIDNGPKPDGGCTGTGYACQSAAVALECVSSTWRPLPCRGPGGCTRDAGQVSCDFTGALQGDACASASVGKAQCTTDAKGVLECQSGGWVKTYTCSSCTVDAGNVDCVL